MGFRSSYGSDLDVQVNSLCVWLAGKTMSLDKNITIEVPEDRFGLYSCDILDPDVVHILLSFSW